MDTGRGHSSATRVGMEPVPDKDGLDEVARLVAELRAIEWWDADYWRTSRPEGYEAIAFVARQKRRSEILVQLVSLVPRLAQQKDRPVKWQQIEHVLKVASLMADEKPRVCPYCEGKSYVSLEVPSNARTGCPGASKTWLRQECPLCGGYRTTLRRHRNQGRSWLMESCPPRVAEESRAFCWRKSPLRPLTAVRPSRP